MIKLNSLKSNKLNKKQIREICILKDSLWKYGFNSQLKLWTSSKVYPHSVLRNFVKSSQIMILKIPPNPKVILFNKLQSSV